MTNRVLVIAPHPDDEILGCGATIAKHIAAGDTVWVVIATNAHQAAPDLYPIESVHNVRQEALDAHKLLGVEETIFMDFPAPALDVFPSYKISLEISEVINQYKPSTLYLPYPGDLHLDHKVIYRAALVAARPQNVYSIRNIYCYETLSETEWAPIHNEDYFKPTHFVEVTDTFEQKLKAISCFTSQIKAFPHSRSLTALEHLAGFRGSTVGVHRAEAFTIERQIVS